MPFIIAIATTSYAHLLFSRFCSLGNHVTLALLQPPSVFSLPRNWLHRLPEKTRNPTRTDVYELINAAVLLPHTFLWVLPPHVT
jgi:hypothetical protein